MSRPVTRPIKRSAIKISLDRAQLAQVDALAGVHGVTRTELAARALQAGLDTYPQRPGVESSSVLTTIEHGVAVTFRAFKPEHAELVRDLITIWENQT